MFSDTPRDPSLRAGPLVTVVIPAYLAEPFIEETLRSVVDQTHRPIEVVVVEDASPDATAQIVEKLATELSTPDFRVRLLRQPRNMGGAAALRRGFAEAGGEYVCWLSADDAFIYPGKTADQLAALASGGGLSFCRRTAVGPTPEEAEAAWWHWFRRLPVLDRLFDELPSWRLLALLFFNVINGSSVMMPRSTIEHFGTFDAGVGNIDQDGDLWMRYSAQGLKFRPIDELAVFYRVHPGQTSNQTDSVSRGCTVNRLRMIMALEESGRLGRLLRRAWPVLIPILRGSYRLWPAVGRRLIVVGRTSGCGISARIILSAMQRRMASEGLWEADDADVVAAARESMESAEYVRFRYALAANGLGARRLRGA